MAGSRVPFNVRQRLHLKHDDCYNAQTLAANKTIAVTEAQFQALDPGGANRNVTLPAEEQNVGLWYCIFNTADAAENLVVKNDAAATITTVNRGEFAIVACDGSAWAVVASTGNAGSDFGSAGISTDVIAESTAAAGVTVDGVLLKDNAVTASGGVTANLTGDVTGNVTGNVSGSSGSCTGNSATATTATTATTANSIAAASVYAGGEQTGTGAEQIFAHGLGAAPSAVWAVATAGHDGAGGAGTQAVTIAYGAVSSTEIRFTVSSGAKFRPFAVK